MKSIVVNYDILTENINRKIALITDLHDYPGKRKNTLAKDVKDQNPDLIIVAGDILTGSKFVMDSDSYKNLKRFIGELSESAPVMLGVGNHDLFGATKEFESAYRNLEIVRPGMVFPLNNESVVSDDIRVVEFHPRHSAFAPAIQDNGRALVEAAEDFQKLGIAPPNDGLYNILISHNPKFAAQAISVAEQRNFKLSREQMEMLDHVREILEMYDLFVAGHLHNGYRKDKTVMSNPKKYMDEGYWEMPMEKDIDGKVTTIRPWVYKKTDMCRGTIYVCEGSERIIELYDGEKNLYFFKNSREGAPLELTENAANVIISSGRFKPIAISGGVNKFFNLPIDNAEITMLNLKSK